MITLTEVRVHLRLDDDTAIEDASLQGMIDTAIASTADYLNMDPDDMDTDAPAPVKSAALLLVGDLYANRERQSETNLYGNRTYERLLNPYRLMSA